MQDGKWEFRIEWSGGFVGLADLADRVETLLNKGWKLHGSIFLGQDNDFCQALIRYKENHE